MGALLISLGILIVMGIGILQWKKPELYEKYYMPDVLFRDGKFALKIYSYPFGWYGYLRWRHKIENVTGYALQKEPEWLRKPHKYSTKKGLAKGMIKKYLLYNEPRVYKHVFGDTEESVKNVITYDDIKKDILKEQYDRIKELLEETDDEDYLDKWGKLENNSRPSISNKQYTNYE